MKNYCLPNLNDFAILMRSNQMDIGPIDHIKYAKAIISVGHHKYPGYSFSFTSGSVVYKKIKQNSQKIVNALYTYSGQINKQKFISNMSTLCRSISHDLFAYGSHVEIISQDPQHDHKDLKIVGLSNTGLAGQNIKWFKSELPANGLVGLAINLKNLSEMYRQLSFEIPLIVHEFRSVGLENLIFPVWDYLAKGFYKEMIFSTRSSHSMIKGLRSTNSLGLFSDYVNNDCGNLTLELVNTMYKARKDFLLRFAARHNEFHQRMNR